MERIREIVREVLKEAADERPYQNNYGYPEKFNLDRYCTEKEKERDYAYEMLTKMEFYFRIDSLTVEERLTRLWEIWEEWSLNN